MVRLWIVMEHCGENLNKYWSNQTTNNITASDVYDIPNFVCRPHGVRT